MRFVRPERAREVLGVDERRVDRRLQIHPEIDDVEQELQRPLVLLVAAGRAEDHVRPAVARRERRRQRGPRPLARREGVRVAGRQVEDLGASPEREAETPG